jgi:hypothetical protein
VASLSRHYILDPSEEVAVVSDIQAPHLFAILWQGQDFERRIINAGAEVRLLVGVCWQNLWLFVANTFTTNPSNSCRNLELTNL